MLQDRARLQQEQALYDAQQQPTSADQAMPDERLQQFHQLQSPGVLGGLDARFQAALGKQVVSSEEQGSALQSSIGSPVAAQKPPIQPHELSLTEQVQQAASVQQSPVQKQSGLPPPFPPAPSQSPLPAPAAQRTGRQSVADQLQTEQRDLSQTPSVDTPSAAPAPWAKEPTEAQRGPSLKQIQEMEAKKAAEAEVMASAARRAAFQKEMEAQTQTIAPAPGLPATASWAAAGGSPATLTGSTLSAWAKAAQKTTGPTPAKSMAQIQKEEEARKRKLAAAAAATAQVTAAGGNVSSAGGKSYANLAGKVSAPTAAVNPAGGAWTTVGASGKVKTPAAPPAPPNTRVPSSGVVPTVPTVATTVRKPPTRSSTMSGAGTLNAQEEFRKWAVSELKQDPQLNKGVAGKPRSTNTPSQPFTNRL